MSNNETMYVLDREMVRVLASIHPAQLTRLSFQALIILAGTAGIEPTHPALIPLALARSADDLARVEWDSLLMAVAPRSHLPRPALTTIFLHLQLFTERAVLHTCLYCSRSASTQWALDTWSVPRHGWPQELAACYGEFGQACQEADRALQNGRSCLQSFVRLLPRECTFDTLQELLRQTNTCYARYLQAILVADQLASAIRDYLASPHLAEIQCDERRVA